MDNILAICISDAGTAIPAEGMLEDKLLAAMRQARTFWLSTDEELRFRGAVSAVLVHYGKESTEWTRIAAELCLLGAFDRMLRGGSVEAFAAEVANPERPIGLLKLWRETA